MAMMTWEEFEIACPRWKDLRIFQHLSKELWDGEPNEKTKDSENIKQAYAWHITMLWFNTDKGHCDKCESTKVKKMVFPATEPHERRYCKKCYEKDIYDREIPEGEEWGEYMPKKEVVLQETPKNEEG